MVKFLPLLVLLCCTGCKLAQRADLEKHRARIKVAECFLFCELPGFSTDSAGGSERSPADPPPCLSAGQRVNFSAPVPRSPRRRFFSRMRNRRQHSRRKGKHGP